MPWHPLDQLFMQCGIPLSCSCSFAFLYYEIIFSTLLNALLNVCCIWNTVIASSVYLVVCFLCCWSVFLLCLSHVSESQKKIFPKKHPLVLRSCQLSAEVLHQMFEKAAEMSSKRQPLSKIPRAKPSSTFSCYITKHMGLYTLSILF